MSSPRNYRGKPVDGTGWVKGFRAAPDQIMIWDEERGVGSMIQVRPETVGQYMGLNDKKGKEGYFGDIAEHCSGVRGVLAWDEQMFRVCFRWNDGEVSYPNSTTGFHDFKFIGNIHDNAELLEEQS